MSYELIPIIIVPALFYFLYLMIKLIFDSLTKRSLIKQGVSAGEVCELMVVNSELSPQISLRRGIILVAVGIPLFLNELIGLEDVSLLGAALITGGVGFIIYYIMMKNRLNT